MVKTHPTSTPANPRAQIFSVQGHPEYTPDIVRLMVDIRSEQGIFDKKTTAEARRRLVGKDGSGGEGYGRVGWAIWRVLLQDTPHEPEVEGKTQPSGPAQADHVDVDMILDRRGPWTAEEFVGGTTVSGPIAKTDHRPRSFSATKLRSW
jgi:hypothetical protein